jgi:hypothetical protein
MGFRLKEYENRVFLKISLAQLVLYKQDLLIGLGFDVQFVQLEIERFDI